MHRLKVFGILLILFLSPSYEVLGTQITYKEIIGVSEILEQAIQATRDTEPDSLKIDLLISIAKAQMLAGNNGGALLAYQEAEQAIEANEAAHNSIMLDEFFIIQRVPWQIYFLIELAKAKAHFQQENQPIFKKAIHVASALSNLGDSVTALSYIATTQGKIGDYDSAKSTFEKAQQISKNMADSPSHMAQVLLAMAKNYVGQGDLNSARACINQTHKLSDSILDEDLRSEILGELIAIQIGVNEKHFSKALEGVFGQIDLLKNSKSDPAYYKTSILLKIAKAHFNKGNK